jgi:hypothetical protein
VIARSNRKSVGQGFVPMVADVLTSFPVELLELPQ